MANVYVTKEDCQSQIDSLSLIRLFSDKAAPTDPEPTDIDTALFDRAENEAAAEIDGYLRGRYTLPLATVPADLQGHAVAITIYKGYQRTPGGTIPEKRQAAYERAISWLKDVRLGKVDLGLEPPPTANSGGDVEISSDEPLFTRGRLTGAV